MSLHIPRRVISSIALFGIFNFVTANVSAEDKGVAYISSQNGGVSVLSLDSMEIKNNLKIGAHGPRGIGITNDGKWLVTANKDDSNISVSDTQGVTAPKLIHIGKNPEFVRILGDKAYVTYEPGSKSGPPSKTASHTSKHDDDDDDSIPGHIAIVDLKKGKLIKDITGKPETEGVEFTKDGKRLLITNESDNSITIHDLKTGKLLKNIAIGKHGDRPRGIKTSPDGKTYVVTLELSDKLLVLNDKFEVTKEVATGKAPYGVSFDRDGKRVFVAANKEKVLQVFDANTYEKIKEIPSGDRCWHFTFTPDDKHLLLACGKSNEVIVVDAVNLEITKHVLVNDMPWGIVTFPKAIGSLDQP